MSEMSKTSTNQNNQNIILSDINCANVALQVSKEQRAEFINRYDLILEQLYSNEDISLNKKSIEVLLNRTLFLSMLTLTGVKNLKEYKHINKLLDECGVKNDDSLINLCNRLNNKLASIGIHRANSIKVENLNEALRTLTIIDTGNKQLDDAESLVEGAIQKVLSNTDKDKKNQVSDIIDQKRISLVAMATAALNNSESKSNIEDSLVSSIKEILANELNNSNTQAVEPIKQNIGLDLEDLDMDLISDEDSDDEDEFSIIDDDEDSDYFEEYDELDDDELDDEPIDLDDLMNEAEEEKDDILKDEDDTDLENTELSDEYKELIAQAESEIENSVETIYSKLSALYMSGFSAMPQDGILVNNSSGVPLIRLKESVKDGNEADMNATSDAGMSYDKKIIDTIIGLMPQLGIYARFAKGEDVIPSINDLLHSDLVIAALHLQFQSANIDFCTGLTSIRKWITETKCGEGKCANSDEWIEKNIPKGTRRLTKVKDVESWYKWSIRNILVTAIKKALLNSEDNTDKLGLISNVIYAVMRNMSNVVCVCDRNIGIKEEIRISTDDRIEVETLVERLESKLNIGNMRSIKVQTVATDVYRSTNVLILRIVYNSKKENSAMKFAYEVTDRLINAGQVPSWSNALLGQREDGTYLFWKDFMDPAKASPSKRVYTIYAASRSGKGIMTSTLLASVIASGHQLFYMDGKPENGAALAEIAWHDGREAYVFDGKPEGMTPYDGFFENYSVSSNGGQLRNPDEIMGDISQCPKELFEKYMTTSQQKLFLGVMRYLRSLQLTTKIVLERARGTLPKDNWQVWVYDEVTQMSEQEKEVRKILSKYMKDKTGAGASGKSDNEKSEIRITMPKDIKEYIEEDGKKFDAGVRYIYNWCLWTASIVKMTKELSTMAMGKSDSNIIFIFQEATWINTDRELTTLGRVVANLKSTKIVGRGALSNDCGEYGNGFTINASWYSEVVNTGKGWWAISEGSDIRGKGAEMTVFKPYVVWTKPLPGSTNDPKCYFEYYIRDLLSRAKLDPSAILQSAYEYAEAAVKTLGLANSLKEFIYSSNVQPEVTKATIQQLRSNLQGEEANPTESSEGTRTDEPTSSSFNISNTDISATAAKPEAISDIDSIDDMDDDIEDMGFDIDEDGDFVQVNRPAGNNSNISSNPFAEFEGTSNKNDATPIQTDKPRNGADVSRFITATELKGRNLSTDDLSRYCNKHSVEQAVLANRFNYNKTDSSTGRKAAAIFASTLVHAAKEIGEYSNEFEKIRSSLIQRALSNGVQATKDAIMVGMLDDIASGRLEYDQTPTNDRCREYMLRFSNKNNNTVNNSDTQAGLNINSNGSVLTSQKPNETLGERILRLSILACRGRNWTAEQLSEFQTALLKKMGAQ